MNNAQLIREQIDYLMCQYVEEYGQDSTDYDYSTIEDAINEISGGINPLTETNE